MVLADGCFDPMHVGHARYLAAARSFCHDQEDLYVRLANDKEIVAKGRQPFQTRKDRERMLAVLGYKVHWAIGIDTLAAFVSFYHPRVLVKGWDWIGRLPADVIEACRDAGTAIVFVNAIERTSTERLA